MLFEKFLGIVRAVEVLAVGIFSRTSVIAAYNEVRDPVILAD